MAQEIVQVEADADDAWDEGTNLTPAANSQYIGDSSGTDYDSLARFQLPNVAQGASISSAYLKTCCDGATSGTACAWEVWASDEDDASFPANHAAYAALTPTTAVVTWDGAGAWVKDTWYDSPDIATIIQEIVNREGWAANQHILLVVSDDGSDADAYRRGYAHNQDNDKAMKLEVNYTNVGGAPLMMNSYRRRRV